ncbi:MAG: helix-turn-helix domain-containing protein, partial [Thermoanaerobaculia bacterium]
MKLGDVLRKERERKKLSLEEMASRLGIPEEKYREMEDGASPA